MLKTRVIASLQICNKGLVKTEKFGKAGYLGDPINAVKIFREKETDELIVLDISATQRGNIDFQLLERISREAFMPMGYGGGIKSLEDVRRILGLGYEKIVINHSCLSRPEIITEIAAVCGSQSVVVCIDAKRDIFGRQRVYDYTRGKTLDLTAPAWARKVADMGAGEILLYDVNRDGTFRGYDLELIASVTEGLEIPLVALGGAGSLDDFALAVQEGGASAVAAGSLFVYHGPHKAVLITYPSKAELRHKLA